MASLKDLVNRVKQYFDPTSNGGNNFWGNSPVAQGLGSVQKGIENFSNKPQFKIAPQIQNPVFRFAAGIPEGIINSPQNSIAGANQLGTNYRQGTLTPQNTLSSFARMADLPLNIATFGGAGAVADQIGKQSLKNVLLNAGKSGIKYGAGFGALGGLQDLNNQDTFLSGAGKVAMGAGTGAVVGAGLGMGLAGAGYGINKFADSKVAEFVGNKLSQKTKISKMDSATAKNLVMTKVAEAGIPVTAGDTPDGMINLLAKRDWQSTNNPALQDAIKLSRFVKATQEGMVVNAPPIGLTTKDIGKDIKVNLKKNLAKDAQAGLYDVKDSFQYIKSKIPDVTSVDPKNGIIKFKDGTTVELGFDGRQIHSIRASKAGTGAGTKVLDALKRYAFENKDYLTIDRASNEGYWAKQGFKTSQRTGEFGWSYDPLENLDEMRRIGEGYKKSVAQQPLSVTQNNMTPVGDILASKPQIEVPKTSIIGQTNAQPIIPPKNVTPQEVAAQLPNKVENFVNKVLGYSTETPIGGTKQASGYTKLLRSGQEAITRKVEQGMGSENSLVRNAATTLQNFFRGLGMSPERANASMELRGGMSTANERAFNVMDSLYKSIDHNKGSLERINAVLDPALSKVKVAFKDLTPQEKQVYGIIREGLNLVHDTSYANGAISKELYLKNQGKYTPRMYDVMELPPEVNKFVTQGKKIVTDLYKSRKELDQWKVENNLNDPIYALGKRLAQVDTNSAIKKYTDFLASNPRFVSDMERPGFTKLSDSPAYGSLSGKYVLNSAAEDLKGFFFANEGMQNLYDVFRAYDRLPIRQLQKKLLTVFNPTTNVGNIVSDQVFGFVTGVDPLTLNKNLIKLKTNPSEFKSLSDYLMRKGITATDITRTDFVNKLGQIDDLASGKKSNMIKILSDKVQSFYGGTDDVYKVSAFKSLLDRGFTTEEAARKVADGFQNYANVGKFYDVWAKTPVVGSAFIKFQGDLMRIIKNGAVNNPLGLITFLGSLYGVAKLSSKLSGETPEDYKTRTERFAAPMIPGLNIPLTWQTPWGEINAARYISPFYANNETTNIAKMLPFVPNIQPNKDVASNIAMNANDPLLAPFVQLAVNRDFRGKPISDPKENKYQPSTLTPQEKLTNQAVFAGRAYLPPPVNSAIDVSSAIQGKPNMYGTPQTTGQAVARLGGIKISNMNSTEVQKIRDNEAQYQQYANDAIDKQISSVTKGLLQNNVTPEQAMKRIEYLSKQKSNITQTGVQKINDKVVKVGNEYKYLDEKGNQQTIADFAIPEAPKLTGNTELDKKLVSKYKGKLTAEANDVVKRWELGIIDQGEAEKQLKQIKAIQNSGKKPKKISVKISKPKMVKISKSKPFKASKSLVNKTPVYKISKARKPKNISIAVGKSKIPVYKIKPFRNTLTGGVARLA